VSVCASEARSKAIDLVLEISDAIGPNGVSTILTDHVRLGQIVTNLVANAIRFTNNRPVRRITVRYDVSYTEPASDTCGPPEDGHGFDHTVPTPEGTPAWLCVSVRDTGPGMSASELANLFQRFSRRLSCGIELIRRG
jgi:signal transduction histidine kinase